MASFRRTFSAVRGASPRLFYLPAAQGPNDQERGNHSYRAIGRLKPGVTIEQAETEAAQLLGGPTEQPARGAHVVDYQIDQTRTVRKPLLLLLAASVVLVLIATLNIATLLLGEAATREREMSARVALGATRLRLVRQMLTESSILASVGALVGLLLAWGMVKVLIALAPPNVPGMHLARIDGRALRGDDGGHGGRRPALRPRAGTFALDGRALRFAARRSYGHHTPCDFRICSWPRRSRCRWCCCSARHSCRAACGRSRASTPVFGPTTWLS